MLANLCTFLLPPVHNVMKFRQTMAEWITENDPEMSRIETETSKFYKALHKYLSERPNFIASMMPTRVFL